MATIDVSKADVLRAIETERDWWRAVFDLAAEAPLTGAEPVNAYWTFQEVIAHVNGWRTWSALRLEAAAGDAKRPIPPWPAELSDDSEDGVDQINAWFLQQSRLRSLNDTMTETFDLTDRLRAAVDRIPEDRLLTPGLFATVDSWLKDVPIGPAVVGWSLAHVHQEHAPDLHAWLSERSGQHVELPPTPSFLGHGE